MTRDPMQELIEAVAQAIYEQWKDQDGYEPWAACGNSLKQDDARQIARAAISRAEQAQGVEDGLMCPRCTRRPDNVPCEACRAEDEPAPAQPGDLMLCTTTCFECGHELHAPFCPACNPEMVSPVWRPDVEEVASTVKSFIMNYVADYHRTASKTALEAAQAIVALAPEAQEERR